MGIHVAWRSTLPSKFVRGASPIGAPDGNVGPRARCETRWRGRSPSQGSHVRTGAQPTLSSGPPAHAGCTDRATYRGRARGTPRGGASGCAACAAAPRARAELSVREAAVRVHTRYVDAWPQRRRARRTADRQYIFDDSANASGEVRFGRRCPPPRQGGAFVREGHRTPQLPGEERVAGLAPGPKRSYFATLSRSLTAQFEIRPVGH